MAARPGGGDEVPSDLEDLLAEVCDRAAASWPDLHRQDARFVAHVGARLRLGPAPSLARALAQVRAADLYLACACAARDPLAIAAFEARTLPAVRATLKRLRLPEASIDDIVQNLRVQLLAEDGDYSIASYVGRGDLGGWVRTIAVHAAYKVQSLERRCPAAAADALDAVAVPGLPLELQLLRAEYAGEFRAAFHRAFARLTPRQRNLLRLRHIDGLSLEELTRVHRASRATVVRWLAQARVDLRAGTEALLAAEVGSVATEMASLIRALDSALEISLRGLLDD